MAFKIKNNYSGAYASDNNKPVLFDTEEEAKQAIADRGADEGVYSIVDSSPSKEPAKTASTDAAVKFHAEHPIMSANGPYLAESFIKNPPSIPTPTEVVKAVPGVAKSTLNVINGYDKDNPDRQAFDAWMLNDVVHDPNSFPRLKALGKDMGSLLPRVLASTWTKAGLNPQTHPGAYFQDQAPNQTWLDLVSKRQGEPLGNGEVGSDIRDPVGGFTTLASMFIPGLEGVAASKLLGLGDEALPALTKVLGPKAAEWLAPKIGKAALMGSDAAIGGTIGGVTSAAVGDEGTPGGNVPLQVGLNAAGYALPAFMKGLANDKLLKDLAGSRLMKLVANAQAHINKMSDAVDLAENSGIVKMLMSGADVTTPEATQALDEFGRIMKGVNSSDKSSAAIELAKTQVAKQFMKDFGITSKADLIKAIEKGRLQGSLADATEITGKDLQEALTRTMGRKGNINREGLTEAFDNAATLDQDVPLTVEQILNTMDPNEIGQQASDRLRRLVAAYTENPSLLYPRHMDVGHEFLKAEPGIVQQMMNAGHGSLGMALTGLAGVAKKVPSVSKSAFTPTSDVVIPWLRGGQAPVDYQK